MAHLPSRRISLAVAEPRRFARLDPGLFGAEDDPNCAQWERNAGTIRKFRKRDRGSRNARGGDLNPQALLKNLGILAAKRAKTGRNGQEVEPRGPHLRDDDRDDDRDVDRCNDEADPGALPALDREPAGEAASSRATRHPRPARPCDRDRLRHDARRRVRGSLSMVLVVVTTVVVMPVLLVYLLLVVVGVVAAILVTIAVSIWAPRRVLCGGCGRRERVSNRRRSRYGEATAAAVPEGPKNQGDGHGRRGIARPACSLTSATCRTPRRGGP